MSKLIRRSTVSKAVSLPELPKALQAEGLTPRAKRGPFYPLPAMRRADIDAELTKIVNAIQNAVLMGKRPAS